jgi:hypothetical protein|nr:MAG TPA: hypothetical protein [Caudoviricetes sp.]
MKNFKIKRVRSGYHYNMLDGERVGTMERSEGGPTPCEGQWFATLFPSYADMMATQWDRWQRAYSSGRTMNECLKNFARKFQG